MSAKVEDYFAIPAENDAAPPVGAPPNHDRDESNNIVREAMAAIRQQADSPDWFNAVKPFTVSHDSSTIVRVAGVDARALFPDGIKVRVRSVASGQSWAFVASTAYAASDTTITLAAFDGGGSVPTDCNGIDRFWLGGDDEHSIKGAAYQDNVDNEFEVPAALTAAAINDAIVAAAAAGKIVLLQQGTYIIETPILLIDDTSLWGRGSERTLLQAANNLDDNMLEMAASVQNVQVRDIAVNGNKANQSTGAGIRGLGNNKNIELSNVHLIDIHGIAIAFDATTGGGGDAYEDLWLDVIHIVTPGSHGVLIEDTKGLNTGVVLFDVRVDNPGVGGAANLSANGIQVDGIASASHLNITMNQAGANTGYGLRAEQADVTGVPSAGMREGVVSNFEIEGTSSNVGGLLVGGQRCTFVGGYVKMTGASAIPLKVDGRGAVPEDASRNNIVGCSFEDGLRCEITADASHTLLSGCRFELQSDANLRIDGDDAMLTGCRFADAGAQGILLRPGAASPVVTGCFIENAGTNGIEVQSGVTAGYVGGCRISNPGGDGIEVRSGAADTVLLNNHIVDATADSIEVQTGALRTVVDGNRCDNSGAQNIDDQANTTTLLGFNTPYEGVTFIEGVEQLSFGSAEIALTGMANIAFPYGADGTRKYKVTCFVTHAQVGGQTFHRMRRGTSGSPLSNAQIYGFFGATVTDRREVQYGELEMVPLAGEMLTISVDSTVTNSSIYANNEQDDQVFYHGLQRTFLRIELVVDQ